MFFRLIRRGGLHGRSGMVRRSVAGTADGRRPVPCGPGPARWHGRPIRRGAGTGPGPTRLGDRRGPVRRPGRQPRGVHDGAGTASRETEGGSATEGGQAGGEAEEGSRTWEEAAEGVMATAGK